MQTPERSLLSSGGTSNGAIAIGTCKRLGAVRDQSRIANVATRAAVVDIVIEIVARWARRRILYADPVRTRTAVTAGERRIARSILRQATIALAGWVTNGNVIGSVLGVTVNAPLVAEL